MEQVFGTLKRSYGYRTVRYLGLARNVVELVFECQAYNLRRALALFAVAPDLLRRRDGLWISPPVVLGEQDGEEWE